MSVQEINFANRFLNNNCTEESLLFGNLPTDLIQRIAFLTEEHKDVVSFSLVNRQLKSLLLENSLFCDFLLKKYFQNSYRCFKSDPELTAMQPTDYYNKLRVQLCNMENGNYNIHTLIFKESAFMPIVIVHGNKIFSGHPYDGIISVWDLKTREELGGITADFHGMTAYDNKVIFSLPDYTIKIVDLETKKAQIFNGGHQERIENIIVYDGKIISGSRDGMIKIRDLETGKELHRIDGINSSLGFKVCDGKIIAYNSSTEVIQTWDLSTGQAELQVSSFLVGCITAYDGKIIGSLGGRWAEKHELQIWDLKTGQKLQSPPVGSHIKCITVYDDKIIAGFSDKVKIWDLRTGKELQTILLKNEATTDIFCITACTGKILVGFFNGTIKILDYT